MTWDKLSEIGLAVVLVVVIVAYLFWLHRGPR